MQIENKVQEIATTTSMTAAQDFLNTLPLEASQALSPSFLSSLSDDVQAELQALIYSHLLWSQQAIQLELAEQQRQAQRRKADLDLIRFSVPKPTLLPQAELREDASSTIEVPGEPVPVIEPQPLSVPALQPRRKHVLVSRSAPRHQVEAPSTPFSLASPNSNDVPPSQLELPVTAEVESLKPDQRRRGKEPQLIREEILEPYSLSPTADSAPRPAEAGRRRRRTSIAMS